MLRVVGCITQDHDLRLVLLAACICVLGCVTTTILLARAQTVSAPATYKWLLGTAAVFGSSIWSLHFIAMLAFMPGMSNSYDIPTTAVSIAVAIAGSLVAFSAWRLLPTWLGSIGIGSAALAASVVGMHYTGVAAMDVPGTVQMDHATVATSIGACWGCAVMAMARSQGLCTGKWRRWEVSGWLALCICALHFIGMSAILIRLGPTQDIRHAVLASNALATVLGMATLSLLIVSLAAALMDAHLSRRETQELNRMRLLSDFAQEGIVIHRDGKVLEVNSAGARLFGGSAASMIGQPILSLFTERSVPVLNRRIVCPPELLLPEEVEIETTAGCSIPVELSCRPIEFKGQPATAVALRDLTDRKRHEARILHLAHHDALTGLPNRSLLSERLSHALAIAALENTKAAVLYLDLDRFKPVNDVLGHAAGDELLVQVANRISAEIRSADTLARVGGDEFIIVQVNAASPERMSALAERIVTDLGVPFQIAGREIEIGVSIGIALYPDDGAASECLLRAADTAMYRVKEEGRGSFRFFDASMDAKLLDRHLLEQDLRRALERSELAMFYQPLGNCRTGEIDEFEGLMRWQHPTRGLVPPSEFIPLAEDIGIIGQLGCWAIDTACRDAVGWDNSAKVAVNVSPIQFRHSTLLSAVADALAQTGLDPARLEIEVTEGVFIDDSSRAVSILSGLRKLGVRVALDDFGTGYSSLNYLRLFSFDKVKIDQSFVQNLDRDGEVTKIVKAIIGLAHNLGLSITAEGVETMEQLAFLREQGTDQLQGFLLGQPMDSATISELHAARVRSMLIDPEPVRTPLGFAGQRARDMASFSFAPDGSCPAIEATAIYGG